MSFLGCRWQNGSPTLQQREQLWKWHWYIGVSSSSLLWFEMPSTLCHFCSYLSDLKVGQSCNGTCGPRRLISESIMMRWVLYIHLSGSQHHVLVLMGNFALALAFIYTFSKQIFPLTDFTVTDIKGSSVGFQLIFRKIPFHFCNLCESLVVAAGSRIYNR